MSIDTTEYISDQLCKAALLTGISKNNGQSNLSDYASSTSSLLQAPKQSTKQVTHASHSSAVNIHQSDKKNNVYYSSLESSSDQNHHEKILEIHT